MTAGNLHLIEYFAGVGNTPDYSIVYSGSRANFNAMLNGHKIGEQVPEKSTATWRENQTDLYTTYQAVRATAEYLRITIDNNTLYYFVTGCETLADDTLHFSLQLDEWATYALNSGVKLIKANFAEGHYNEIPEVKPYATTAGRRFGRCELVRGATETARHYEGEDAVLPITTTSGYGIIIALTLTNVTNHTTRTAICTTAADLPVALETACQYVREWGGCKDVTDGSGRLDSDYEADFFGGWVLPLQYIRLFRKTTGGETFEDNRPHKNAVDLITIDTGVKHFTTQQIVWDDHPVAVGTFTNRINATPQYMGKENNIDVCITVQPLAVKIVLTAFGNTLDISNDYVPNISYSELMAKSNMQRITEAMQNITGAINAAVSAVGSAYSGNAMGVLGSVNSGVNVAMRAINQNFGGGSITKNVGNAETTYTCFDYIENPDKVSGIAVWTYSIENESQIINSFGRWGVTFPDGLEIDEDITTIFHKNATSLTTPSFIRINSGSVVGCPTDNAETLTNALKRGVYINYL